MNRLDSYTRLNHKIAPYQIVIVPVIKNEADTQAVMDYINNLRAELNKAMPFGEKIRVKLDKRDKSSVDKFWEWTRKGAPIILEIGKRDADGNNVMMKRRIYINTPEGKQVISKDDIITNVAKYLQDIQDEMFKRAKNRMLNNIRTDIKTPEEFRAYFANASEWIEDGKQGKVAFVRGKWSGDENSDALLKELKITIRCLPFDQSGTEGVCLLTGKPATIDVIYAKCY